jgi:hypothetical protein
MDKHLLLERARIGRCRWLRMADLPFSRKYAIQLIREGKLASVLLQSGSDRRSIRLIDANSLDQYVETQGVKHHQPELSK